MRIGTVFLLKSPERTLGGACHGTGTIWINYSGSVLDQAGRPHCMGDLIQPEPVRVIPDLLTVEIESFFWSNVTTCVKRIQVLVYL